MSEEIKELEEKLRKLKLKELEEKTSDAKTDLLIAGGVERKLAEGMSGGEKDVAVTISTIVTIGAVVFLVWILFSLCESERAIMDLTTGF